MHIKDMRNLVARVRAGLKINFGKQPACSSRGSVDESSSCNHAQGTAGQLPPGLLPERGNHLSSQLHGAGILMLTTILWASGGPTSKYLFLLPTPPSAALLTACISVITALFLGVGLIGHALDLGGRRSQTADDEHTDAAVDGGTPATAVVAANFAAWDHTSAAAVAALPRQLPLVNLDPDGVEAEALLHSGMHTTGGAGGALAAAWVAARQAAKQQECEATQGTRAHERALPLLPSHGIHYYSSLAGSSYSRTDPWNVEMPPGSDTTQRWLDSEVLNETEPRRLYDDGNRSSGGGDIQVAVLHDSPHMQSLSRRGPSLDGTTGPHTVLTSPPPLLRPCTGAESSRLPPAVTGGTDARVTATRRQRSTGGSSGECQGPGRWHLRLLTVPARSLPAAGIELGIYNVTAAALAAWGMQRISATRSAFLAQATSLLTPLLVWLSGGTVGLVVWLACCCGALGGSMVALDSVYGSAAAAAATATAASDREGRIRLRLQTLASSFDSSDEAGRLEQTVAVVNGGGGGGEWQVEGVFVTRQAMGAAYVLLSCVFWGLGTVRLGVHSARYPPLHLAAAAAMSYAGLSLGWLLVEIVESPSAGLSDFLELGLLLRDHATAALLMWAGLGPGALSSYLQVLGQQTVPPAQAQVLFSSTPLWSALIAQLLLPGEAMGPLAWLGGAVMLVASLAASLWQ